VGGWRADTAAGAAVWGAGSRSTNGCAHPPPLNLPSFIQSQAAASATAAFGLALALAFAPLPGEYMECGPGRAWVFPGAARKVKKKKKQETLVR
jgi:hypothetical protein